MKMDSFMDRLLAAAAQSGIETAEIYYQEGEGFRAGAMNGEINAYEVSQTCGLSLRGTVNGRMGYASTQAFDDAAIGQLIEGVKDSAALTESHEQDEIFAGEKEYPALVPQEDDLSSVTAEAKLDACLRLEKAAKEADERIKQAESTTVATTGGLTRIRNSYGLDLKHEDRAYVAYTVAIAKEEGSTGLAVKFSCGRKFAALNPEEIGKAAAKEAIQALHGEPVGAGEYRVIIRRDAMADLLGTFCGVFSAENAQQSLSLLAGKEGCKIASDAVTLLDDPLLPGGYASCPFDAEGSASRTKAVIDQGVLTTLLHNRKTAHKQGVSTTGNASRASYAAPVHVSPTNFFFKPGTQDLDGLMAQMGEGLVITELNGLHSGADAISGDFSLLSKGYTVTGGKRGTAVEQITVAGNFYRLLENIRAVGSDLEFPGSGIGSSSVDVGMLMVSGK